MSTESNKAIVRRFVEEVQGRGNLEVIDEIFARDYVDHQDAFARDSGTAGLSDLEASKQFFKMSLAAFSDPAATIHDQIAEGDKVVTRKTLAFTHRGPFMGIPATGKRVEQQVIDIFRVVEGKIVEHWMATDRLALMQQLGLVPPPGAGR